MIAKVKGTQDFLDLDLYNFALNIIRKHLVQANFTEVNTPVLEPTELYQRSLGIQTDVVKKEMYTFGDDNELCLRPEITASIVRAFCENNIQQIPWKVFEFGTCFRHERPQKGRFREFHQVSIEIIGAASIAQDAFLIRTLDTLFHQQFKLNSYALQLNYLGTIEDRIKNRNALVDFLKKNTSSLCKTCQERTDTNPLRVFDCKSEECQKIYQDAPKITDFLSAASQKEWLTLKKLLDLLSVTYTENPKLVRGLDYYNKTVFEFVSLSLGAQNTFCGGGRYDSLVKEIGGKDDQGCIGAAIGLERLLMLLEPLRTQLPLPQQQPLTAVIPIDATQQALALLIADNLLAQGKCVDLLLDDASIKSKMRKANKMGAHWAVILGPEELEQKRAVLKNMTTGQEKTVAQIDLAKEI